MRRRKGMRKIDRIVEPTSGVSADIYLRTEDGTFETECTGVRFADASLAALKKQVLDHLRKTISLSWLEIIEVRLVGSHWMSSNGLSLRIERVFIAPRPGAQPLRTEALASGYEAEDNDSRRLDRSRPMAWGLGRQPFAPPCWDREEETAYLLYTPEIYAALLDLDERIGQARKDLMRLLSTPGLASRALREHGEAITNLVPRDRGAKG